ncbi:MAG: LutB/LldF family L-lactate oxidation iron-sulfur protein [Bacteroidales bacterium]|jgi:L-lactate dehydrogenase complex protein LldF|nr:LutB/LldF family L-lactate oxidation iron-sulfur protein [Bacteroidales bacterium]
MNKKKQFIKAAEEKAFDLKHRETLRFNISRYNQAVKRGKLRYDDLEGARSYVANLKRQVLSRWDEYLIEFEEKATQNGIIIHWAEDSQEALDHLATIIKDKQAKLMMKSKSMVTEELELNEAVEKMGVRVVETDLGEFIVQTAGEKPYHILTPAMHKSKGDVADLFHKEFGTDLSSTPEEMTEFVRQKLRIDFQNSDIGISGANFLVADIGGIALTENEGNGLMTTAFPKTPLAITGIEKLLPSFTDMATVWTLLSQHGTGQQITAYNSIFTGAKKGEETDGPEEMHLILLDNGRTNLYATEEQYEALSCIRCGACLNACPIYRNVGGYTYDAVYSGPIGSVITPHFKGMKDYNHLSFASSTCGRCTEVCPVKIPLHELLLINRRDAVAGGMTNTFEKQALKIATTALKNRTAMDFIGGSLKNMGAQAIGKTVWGDKRDMPTFAKESYSKQQKKNKLNLKM